MQALSMQEERLKVDHDDTSPTVGVQQALDESLCFYCKSATFDGKISKPVFLLTGHGCISYSIWVPSAHLKNSED